VRNNLRPHSSALHYSLSVGVRLESQKKPLATVHPVRDVTLCCAACGFHISHAHALAKHMRALFKIHATCTPLEVYIFQACAFAAAPTDLFSGRKTQRANFSGAQGAAPAGNARMARCINMLTRQGECSESRRENAAGERELQKESEHPACAN
jgi:hypothetical protein